ncbi:hypothetical protein JOC34_000620 [Virgibacillus halotolerans]|uniref:hypothetical protein n=1 Tax=Virgibacillus halotolerans TaxID=1071053 RepID=UPI00195F5D22|nr:hypothetical protein [Virgibacillus halotolerans]MBM7598263.1 hypothetical protein [Virgibacillus halotolerans]
MNNAMIAYLKELNKSVTRSDEVVTRLYYGDSEYVEDFSYFANEDYMSKGLLEAIKNKTTLTDKQSMELQYFVQEDVIS